MFALKRITNRLHRWYYRYALVGFAALSLGYLLRGQINQTNALVILLLSIFPNLLGSFATPFLLAFLLVQHYPSRKALDRLWVFGLINLFSFAVSVLIEYLHVVFCLGIWDANDIAASIAGGMASLVLFYLTQLISPTPFR